MAIPMVKERNVASIILENPFYGLRKPKNQLRSSLHYVSDLFLMGACLIMESHVLLKWAEDQGFGPLCSHGISMGGHMASLAASAWPKPIGLVPCLSWTSASVTFCNGVMSKAINWKLMENQLKKDEELYHQVWKLVHSPEFNTQKAFAFGSRPNAHLYMRGLMDECTHLQNYSKPVDCGLINIVQAQYDAYQPRRGVIPLQELWPGCSTKVIEEGHIKSYLFNQGVFRSAVYSVLDKLENSYVGNVQKEKL